MSSPLPLRRIKTKEIQSTSNRGRLRRGEPMPWLSTRLGNQRPVFALTLKRLMSGCEMVDYGVGPRIQEFQDILIESKKENKNDDEDDKDDDGIDDFSRVIIDNQSVVDCNDNKIFENLSNQMVQHNNDDNNYDYSISSHMMTNWWDINPHLAIGKNESFNFYNSIESSPTTTTTSATTASASTSTTTTNELQIPEYCIQTTQQQMDGLLSVLLSGTTSNTTMTSDGQDGGGGGEYCDLDAYQIDVPLRIDENVVEMNIVKREDNGMMEINSGKRKRKHKNRDMKEWRISCTKCNKRFRKEGHLKSHFAVHIAAEAGATNCPCHVCGKGFCHRGALALHMRAHIPRQIKKID